MQKNVTIKDVANAVGVSSVTVHRVLNNKEGVSTKVREKVLSTSSEMGYKLNHVASMLKRKTIRVGVVTQTLEEFGKYYIDYIWSGYRKCQHEMNDFNIEYLEFSFKGDENAQAALLDEVFDKYGKTLDGLITFPIKHQNVKNSVRRFCDINVPVVLVGHDLTKINRLCSIIPDDKTAGNIGAELMWRLLKTTGEIVVAAGDSTVENHIAHTAAFESEMKQYNPQNTIKKFYHFTETDLLKEELITYLQKNPQVVGIYANNARNTLIVGEIVEHLHLQEKMIIIGNDLNDGTISLLNKGTLHVVINKNPFDQGYVGAKTLFNYILKGEKPTSKVIYVGSEIVVKSSLKNYENKIKGV